MSGCVYRPALGQRWVPESSNLVRRQDLISIRPLAQPRFVSYSRGHCSVYWFRALLRKLGTGARLVPSPPTPLPAAGRGEMEFFGGLRAGGVPSIENAGLRSIVPMGQVLPSLTRRATKNAARREPCPPDFLAHASGYERTRNGHGPGARFASALHFPSPPAPLPAAGRGERFFIVRPCPGPCGPGY
jgi:hypothetical protein